MQRSIEWGTWLLGAKVGGPGMLGMASLGSRNTWRALVWNLYAMLWPNAQLRSVVLLCALACRATARPAPPLQEELDPGAVVAMGVPMTGGPAVCRLHAWICARAMPELAHVHSDGLQRPFFKMCAPCSRPPLAATLLAPLWVVNATSLAIDAVVVPLEAAPPPGPSSGVSLRGRRMSAAAADTLRCVLLTTMEGRHQAKAAAV